MRQPLSVNWRSQGTNSLKGDHGPTYARATAVFNPGRNLSRCRVYRDAESLAMQSLLRCRVSCGAGSIRVQDLTRGRARRGAGPDAEQGLTEALPEQRV